MIRTQIYITNEERAALNVIAKQTAKTQSELIREAIDVFLEHYRQNRDKKKILKKARGIWKNRTDLPDFKALRKEFDRYKWENNE